MEYPNWIEEFGAAITVCDRAGKLLALNKRAGETFAADYGGKKLIGQSIFDCHPEPARTKLQNLLTRGQANVYTIEKDGVKKLIYQAPWYKNGRFKGLVELSLPLPADLPHFVRE